MPPRDRPPRATGDVLALMGRTLRSQPAGQDREDLEDPTLHDVALVGAGYGLRAPARCRVVDRPCPDGLREGDQLGALGRVRAVALLEEVFEDN